MNAEEFSEQIRREWGIAPQFDPLRIVSIAALIEAVTEKRDRMLKDPRKSIADVNEYLSSMAKAMELLGMTAAEIAECMRTNPQTNRQTSDMDMINKVAAGGHEGFKAEVNRRGEKWANRQKAEWGIDLSPVIDK